MLIVRDLVSGYGSSVVVNRLGLTVQSQEFVGILGHNGMGKSTLLKTLIGVLPARSGAIVLDGAELTATPPHMRARAGMGYVPQGRGILPGLSVLDNLLFAAAAVKRPKDNLEEVLSDFPRLKAYLARPGGALSGGEQQLLALARTLIQEPRIVLLDEPTEGIQPSIIHEIVDQLQALRHRRKLTILLVEQNIDFIRSLSDRVLLIQRGAIAAEMKPEDLTDAIAMGDFAGLPHG